MTNETSTVGTESVAFEFRDGVVVASQNTTEITPNVGDLLNTRLKEVLREGTGVDFIWDLSGLQFLSSIGITVALMFSKHVSGGGGKLCLAGLKGQCLNVMQVVGLTRVFDIYPDIQTGIQALRQKRSGGPVTLERRSGADARAGKDRRQAQMPFEGPDRRSGLDRRCNVQRRGAR